MYIERNNTSKFVRFSVIMSKTARCLEKKTMVLDMKWVSAFSTKYVRNAFTLINI
jgi:hypothetical protein